MCFVCLSGQMYCLFSISVGNSVGPALAWKAWMAWMVPSGASVGIGVGGCHENAE